MISKRIKIFGLILAGLCSLMLAGCGTGSDKVSTGYYKNVAIKPNGEFVIKDRVDDSKAKKGGIFYYVEMGKDDATKDKIVSVTAKAGNAPIDILNCTPCQVHFLKTSPQILDNSLLLNPSK